MDKSSAQLVEHFHRVGLVNEIRNLVKSLHSDTDTESMDFEPGMRLEAVDRQNPSLVCVATLVTVDRARGDCLLIHFDGWTEK